MQSEFLDLTNGLDLRPDLQQHSFLQQTATLVEHPTFMDTNVDLLGYINELDANHQQSSPIAKVNFEDRSRGPVDHSNRAIPSSFTRCFV